MQSKPDVELGEWKLWLNESQKEFFREVEKNTRYIGFGGGIGNGKTLAGCIQALRMAAQYPNNLVLIGRLKGSDLEASTKKTMLEVMSPWLVSKQAEYKVKDNKIVLENGSEIVFRHLEEIFSSGILGMNLGYFYIDQAEETSEDVFNTLTGRLRRISKDENGNEAVRGGILTFNMAGHNWIWRLFKKKWDKQKEPLKNPEDYGLVEASTLDNQKNLPADYVKDLLAHDKDWVAKYVYGSWDTFGGQVFDDFDVEKHVIKHREPEVGSVIYCGIDPGYVDPFAVIWMAVEPGGQKYVFDEHYFSGKPTAWHAEVIKQKNAMRWQPMATFVDAANAMVIADLNGAGVYCNAAKKETLQSSSDVYTGGINKIKDLLKFDPVTQRSGIIISDRCQNLIYELQQYAWKERKGEFNAPEVPEGKNDHAIDALRYIILNYFDSAVSQGRSYTMK